MGADEHLGAISLLVGDDAVEGGDFHLIHIGPEGFGDEFRRFPFIARHAGKRRYLAQKFLGFHTAYSSHG